MTRAIAIVLLAAACGGKATPAPSTATATTPAPGPTPEPEQPPAPLVVDWAKAGVDWTRPPEPGPEPAYTPPVPVTFELRNGVRVVLVENRRLPLVSVRLVHARAGAREDGKEPGLAALTIDLVDEGAGALDALALPQALELLGADLDTGVAEDAAVIYLDTLASTLEDSLALLADVVVRPRMDAKDFERIKGDALEELKLRPQEPRRVAAVVFDRVLLGRHPYGQPPTGFVRTIEKITLRDVRAFWKKHYVPAHATVIVAGDVDRATLEPILARTLGAWKGAQLRAARRPSAPQPTTPSIAFVDRPGAPQSVVMIGRAGPDADDPAYFAAEVVNTAIGGSFAARLNGRLREELGYTYGVFSAFWRGEWAGTWSATTSLKTDVTVAGIREALAILERAMTEPLPAPELAKAQQLMTRQLPQAFETNAGIAGQLTELVVDRRPLDWHQGYVDSVRAVTAEQAKTAAASAWDALSIVVVGDWAAVGAELGALGLPIVHVDAEGKPAAAPKVTSSSATAPPSPSPSTSTSP